MDTTSTPAPARLSLWHRWPATILSGLAAATSLVVVATTSPAELPEPQTLEDHEDDEAPVAAVDAVEHAGELVEPPLAEAAPHADGTRHRGEEGKMGKPTSRAKSGLYAMKGPKAAAPAGFAAGSDDADVWGSLPGSEIGEAYGVGGLGLIGTGRGGGGTGESTIGLGHGVRTIAEGRYDAAIQSHALTVGTVDDNADPAGYAKALERLSDRASLGIAESMWHLTPARQRHDARPSALDVALVIDTTGSMGDELEYLKVEIRDIATEIARELPGVQQRWALVVYRDQGDEYVTRHFDFQGIDDFVDALGRQTAEGGGDMPEALDAALDLTTRLSWRGDAGTARMVFLVADAPSHEGAPARRFADAVVDHRRTGTAIYPVAGSGVDLQAEAQLRLAARATGGQYIFLTDHSGIGGHHAAPQVEQYKVETLHAAMTRMIRTELGASTTAPAFALAPVAPQLSCDTPEPITLAFAEASFWDEFKARLAEHLQFASSMALLMFAGIGVDTVLSRRRRRARSQ